MKMHSLLFVVSLGACVALPGYANDPADQTQLEPAVQVEPDELSLRKRVSSRWDTLIAKDFTAGYEYFSPAYRKLFPPEHYLRETGRNLDWVSIDLRNISMDGNRAEVELMLFYRVNIPPEAGFGMTDDIGLISKKLTEIWLWENGNWWYIDRHSARL